MASTKSASSADLSAFAPLRYRAFRTLWLVWLSANTCSWMIDVTSAWTMTSLTTNAMYVALVQSAAALPVFAFGIVSGVFADLVDRRRYLIVSQCWIAIVACAFLVVSLTGSLTPLLLLLLTFANGFGMAMRWPVTAALTAELLPREHVSSAIALNGVALNASRIAGPALAGALLSELGSEAIYVLNVLASLATVFALLNWSGSPAKISPPPERFFSAMHVGALYVLRSPRARYVLVHTSLFTAHAITLFALAPLIAMHLGNGGAETYTFLLGAMGIGAILVAMKLPALRRRFHTDDLVLYATLLSAAMTFAVAFVANVLLAAVAMMLAGMAFVTALNSLHVVAQLALPNRVRARAMAWVQMTTMGGSALGAAVWGKVAEWADVQTSLLASAAFAALSVLLTLKLRLDGLAEEGDEVSDAADSVCAAD